MAAAVLRSADDRARPARRPRLLDQLAKGRTVGHIADAGNYPLARVEKILRAELRDISIRPARDYAKIQISRLETILGKLTLMANEGDLGAVDRLLKVLDRLDRYHAGGAMSDASLEAETLRQRLYAKIAHAARIRPALERAPEPEA